MKIKSFILLFLIPALAVGQSYKQYKVLKDRLVIELTEGSMNIIPLSDKAIRIQWEKELLKEDNELILNNPPHPTHFSFSENGSFLNLSTTSVTVRFNKMNLAIDFTDKSGKIFLSEKAGSRKLTDTKTGSTSCYIAEQGFISPEDESLFGLGQFQDGHYNLRNVSRKLIQVNTQIAIPFLYSSKGFGLLWHQYGLTHFNPADNTILLTKKDSLTKETGMTEVTTTSGTQRVSRQQSVYTGNFSIEKDGTYFMMLDMGNMESRHLLVIDGIPVIDQSNLWLPPAASMPVKLKAGEHTVQVVCKTTNTPSLSWRLNTRETIFRSPNAKSLDYVVFYGKNAEEVIGAYRNLSGNVPMLPLWAYGFWQCRERYTSGKHLVETVKEFRKRKLPVDVIVQDWQYWGKNGWGVPQFDTTNYPNPEGFIEELHNLHAKFSISVWENMDKKSSVAQEYVSKNLYIPNSPWIDIFNPETQKTHWNVLNKNLFRLGVDSWWMDATEPENDALTGKQTYLGSGDLYRLTYPLFVSKSVYEGQRNTDPSKRVVILTRSAFAGQQRYGTINWSGDIGWDWDSYKRQIVAGLHFNLTGMPYWTTDIGGFFRPGNGQYTDPQYHEILTRWFQWGVFNPIFRIHGYQTETEPWKYGEQVENNMRKMMNLRYRLLPYIYSSAWQVSQKGSTLMRPLVMDFSEDTLAISQAYQYMFGKNILVAPVTAPNINTWDVYLPKTNKWYDFWTGKKHMGGQYIKAAAPSDKIPLFVKAGSIIPLGKEMQYSNEKPNDSLEIRIYTGADGSFNLYEDEGDNYNYEKGKYTVIPFHWNDKKQTLTIGTVNGSYPGYLKRRAFSLVFISEGNIAVSGQGFENKMVKYNGEKLTITPKK
ncbi:MAG: DUF5110 domain-containing protein [Chitinophagales bacterium]|nr:DUF5110 domain-containing protein [Chitinophagales bacterium]